MNVLRVGYKSGIRFDHAYYKSKHLPLAGFVGALIALEMTAILMGGFRLTEAPEPSAAALKLGNTKLLGIEVYTHYLYPLQIAAVLLLVAIVAAIALTLRQRKDSKHIDPSLQVRVKARDRLQVVKLPPTLPVAPAEPAAATETKA